jgi:hypothetical protein
VYSTREVVGCVYTVYLNLNLNIDVSTSPSMAQKDGITQKKGGRSAKARGHRV